MAGQFNKIGKHNRRTHRLLIKVEDETQNHFVQDGKILIPCKWIEVNEADFGSLAKPNKKIHGFKLLPIEYD